MTTQRIKPGERIRWRTYPDAGAGPEYDGKVLAFIPAGADLYLTYYAIPISQRVHPDASPSGLLSVSKRDRYLVMRREIYHDRRSSSLTVSQKTRTIYHCPNAATVERQNPDAQREL